VKVLVVEDAQEVVETIDLCFSIRWPDTKLMSTGEGKEAPQLVELETPDIVILDLGLPDVDGIEVLQEIRSFSNVPVLIVTARGEETDRVMGLEKGADDYIVKPFSHTELMARVQAILRRAHMPELRAAESVIAAVDLNINFSGRRLQVKGKDVALTPTEWSLLSHLAHNEGMVVSHQALAEKVWSTDYLDDSVIKMAIRRLRIKLGDDPQAPRLVHSHRGLGYSFVRPR